LTIWIVSVRILELQTVASTPNQGRASWNEFLDPASKFGGRVFFWKGERFPKAPAMAKNKEILEALMIFH
jgi:hypothetical protein